MTERISCPDLGTGNGRGVMFLTLSLVLVVVAIAAVVLRLYTRLFLTRSAGSDDATIVIATITLALGSIFDVLAVTHGWGSHCSSITAADLAITQKWTYITWQVSFLGFFFLRSSVMLFTLRLLPRVKIRSQYVIYLAFSLNLAVTLIACIGYGAHCRPFSALWSEGGTCGSEKTLSATQQVNGILSCLADIMTALVPAFLLWNVQMRRQTKIILNAMFLLGLITAGLSIGRAVTSPPEVWDTDVTYRTVPSHTFTLVESKLGTLLACGPALRQLFVYRKRNNTIKPVPNRNPPNSDFHVMRHRVNIRDFFWRGKQDPVRAQGLINAASRRGETSLASTAKSVDTKGVDPEDSPLSMLEARVVERASLA